MAGSLRHHIGPGRAAVPRVRALYDGGDERLHRPQGAQLRAPLRGPVEAGGRRGRSPHHGVERRRRDCRDGGGRAGHHAHVGPCRRCAGWRLGGGALRAPAPHYLRRGRHQRRHRHRDRRPLQRGHRARHLDRRLPGAGADDRYHDHRCRWRQHRAHRRRWRFQGRARERGLRARPRLLRAWRQRADGDRRQHRAWPAGRGQLSSVAR